MLVASDIASFISKLALLGLCKESAGEHITAVGRGGAPGEEEAALRYVTQGLALEAGHHTDIPVQELGGRVRGIQVDVGVIQETVWCFGGWKN